jgi:hypothetical protein
MDDRSALRTLAGVALVWDAMDRARLTPMTNVWHDLAVDLAGHAEVALWRVRRTCGVVGTAALFAVGAAMVAGAVRGALRDAAGGAPTEPPALTESPMEPAEGSTSRALEELAPT